MILVPWQSWVVTCLFSQPRFQAAQTWQLAYILDHAVWCAPATSSGRSLHLLISQLRTKYSSSNCLNYIRRTKSSIMKRIIVRWTVRSMFGKQTLRPIKNGLYTWISFDSYLLSLYSNVIYILFSKKWYFRIYLLSQKQNKKWIKPNNLSRWLEIAVKTDPQKAGTGCSASEWL